jgi:hypothetical protein
VAQKQSGRPTGHTTGARPARTHGARGAARSARGDRWLDDEHECTMSSPDSWRIGLPRRLGSMCTERRERWWEVAHRGLGDGATEAIDGEGRQLLRGNPHD